MCSSQLGSPSTMSVAGLPQITQTELDFAGTCCAFSSTSAFDFIRHTSKIVAAAGGSGRRQATTAWVSASRVATSLIGTFSACEIGQRVLAILHALWNF